MGEKDREREEEPESVQVIFPSGSVLSGGGELGFGLGGEMDCAEGNIKLPCTGAGISEEVLRYMAEHFCQLPPPTPECYLEVGSSPLDRILEIREEAREALRQRGYLQEEPGGEKAPAGGKGSVKGQRRPDSPER